MAKQTSKTWSDCDSHTIQVPYFSYVCWAENAVVDGGEVRPVVIHEDMRSTHITQVAND